MSEEKNNFPVKKKRIISIDVMASLMMIFVVLGHQPGVKGALWYVKLHDFIYSFHMSVFICVSGFLIAYTSFNGSLKREYSRSLKKALKFFLLIISVGSLVIFLDAFVTGRPADAEYWRKNIKLLLLYPFGAIPQFLWYIYLLTWMYLSYPILKRLPDIAIILLGCWLVYAQYNLPHSYFFGWNLVCRYGPFYMIAIMAYRKLALLRKIPLYGWFIAGIPFVIYAASYCVAIDFIRHLPFVLMGAMALPFWAGIAIFCSRLPKIKSIVSPISRNLLPLYLGQLFILKLICIAVLPFVEQNPNYFLLYLIAASVFAIVFIVMASEGYAMVKRRLVAK